MKSANQNSWFFTILHQISAFFCILLLIRPAFLLDNQSSFGDLISLLPDFAFVMFMKICHQPQAHSRGRGRGAQALPEIFRFELNSAIERFSNDCRKNQNQSNYSDQSQQEQTAR